jgi:hypothetical protein
MSFNEELWALTNKRLDAALDKDLITTQAIDELIEEERRKAIDRTKQRIREGLQRETFS